MSSNVEVVLATFRAVEERDRERLFELYHDDVEFQDAPSLPYGGITRGKAAIRAQLEVEPESTWLGTWGPLQPTDAERRMDPQVVGSGGEQVAVVYTQRALAAGGERFEAPVMGLYEVRDGKFARAQMFHFDTAALVTFLARAAGSESGTGVAGRASGARSWARGHKGLRLSEVGELDDGRVARRLDLDAR
jgi:ketosteroid isomerase-like protein